MKILFCGDVMGRSGREAVFKHVPALRAKHGLDCVIVNGENSASGYGINTSICNDFYKHGVDVITTGNHVWDQREMLKKIDSDKRLLRPANYPDTAPGSGYFIHQTVKGQRVLVINIMGKLFMESLDDPFQVVERLVKNNPMPTSVNAIVVDIHAEATSEKVGMGHFLDGRVSLVVGTHTHIPTADHMILNKGTAYQTDAGMCGDYDSVIGMEKEAILYKFTRRLPSTERPKPASGEATLCGVIVETDDQTGLALKITPIRLGGKLSQQEE